MQRLYEEDKARVFVEVSAGSLEEALAGAAVELGVSVRNIDYEVLQKGAKGFFALSKKDWKIRAYQAVKKTAAGTAAAEEENAAAGPAEDHRRKRQARRTRNIYRRRT